MNDVDKLLTLTELLAPSDFRRGWSGDLEFWLFLKRNFPNLSRERQKSLCRRHAEGGALLLSIVNELGLQDALTVCMGENPRLVDTYARPVAGVGDVVRNPAYVIFTLAGKALMARRRVAAAEANQTTEAEPPDDWADYRNGPGGPLLTANECRERFSVSNSVLSREAKQDTSIRRKNPGGRGFVYRYDVVSRIANRKPDDD